MEEILKKKKERHEDNKKQDQITRTDDEKW